MKEFLEMVELMCNSVAQNVQLVFTGKPPVLKPSSGWLTKYSNKLENALLFNKH